MGGDIRAKLYVGYVGVLLLLGSILLLLVVPHLGWGNYQAIAAILALGALLALLLIHRALAKLMRALNMLGAALLDAREGRFSHLATAAAPKELAPLIGSYNAMCETLDLRGQQFHNEMRRTALLTRLSIELRESLDPQMIVRDILSAIVANTDAEAASIMVIAPDGTINLASVIRDGQICAIPPDQGRAILERGMAGWVLRHGRSVVLADVAHDDRWVPLDDRSVGSAMVLPLTYRRVTLGVLTITHSTRDWFTSQDLLLLEGVGAQAGVALNAAYRLIEERHYREQALLLFSMSQFLTSERLATDLATELLEKSDTVFESDHMALFLAEHNATTLELFAARAHPGSQYDTFAPNIAAIAKRAWQSQKTITEPLPIAAVRLQNSNGAVAAPTLDAPNPTDLVCVAMPLLHNGAAIGAFTMVRHASGSAIFSARGWSMLTTFTNVAAAAFANQQLVNRLHLRADELERLVDERTAQLQHSRDLLRIIFDHLPDGLMLMDTESCLLAANNAFCRDILGVRPEAIIGRDYPEVVKDIEHSLYLKLEPQAYGTESQRVISTDLVGQQRWFEVDRYTIAAGAFSNQQVIERWRDVTKQEELHRRLLLHEQLTSLGHLAASIVHDVGNPLQSVRSCLELCREDAQLPDSIGEYLTLADDELERISQSLERLRDFYRMPNLEWVTVDLNDLIGTVRQLTARQLGKARIEVDAHCATALPSITGQPDALRQVLLSLLFHAQETMPCGGAIHVTTYTDPQRRMSCISIVDTGDGLSDARISTIFEPFQGLQAQRPGLGMYLCKQVIQQHQGSIDVSSQAGTGTTVIVGLPWREVGNG